MRLDRIGSHLRRGVHHGFPGVVVAGAGESPRAERRWRLPSPIGDTLALFVVRELAETFDPEASDGQQVAEAIRVIAAARNNLDNIVSALESRRVAGIVEAASNVLGYDVEEDRVREALDEHGETPLKALKKALKEKEKTFKDQGGRGVDLADEIDSLRIAIAVRNAK